MDKIDTAFHQYVAHASALLTEQSKQVLGLTEDASHEVERLRRNVTELETDARFAMLVSVADRLLLEEHRVAYGQPDQAQFFIGEPPKPPASLREHLRCFFRLSGTYLDMSRRESVDAHALLDKFVSEVRRNAITVRDVVPIEGAALSLSSDVPFGNSMMAHRGSARHIWNERGYQIDKAFFPDAMLDETLRMFDLVIHQNTWTPVQLQQSVGHLGPHGWVIELDLNARSRRFPKGHGEDFERDLDVLRLFDWSRFRPVWMDDSEFVGPSLSTRIRAHDSLLYRPFQWRSRARIKYIEDSQESEERKRRSDHLELDSSATAELAGFLKEVAELRQRVAGIAEWRFVERALQYVRKAEMDVGFDQFVLLVCAVEALFGENAPGLTKRLKSRWAAVLGGDSPADRQSREQQFSEFYKLRSKYVHGAEDDEHINLTHLKEINVGVREALVRVIRMLGSVPNAQLSTFQSRASFLRNLDQSNTKKKPKKKAKRPPARSPTVRGRGK
jgi:hypothetical protein